MSVTHTFTFHLPKRDSCFPLSLALAATVRRRGSVSESGARSAAGGGNDDDEEFQSIEKRKTERRKSLDLGLREGRTDGHPDIGGRGIVELALLPLSSNSLVQLQLLT